jgi:hypothetical protein
MLPKNAKLYIAAVIASGCAVLLLAAKAWNPANLKQFAIYLGLTVLASTLKIRIRGIESTITPNFVFLLLAVNSCSFSQVMAMSVAAALIQCLWRSAKRPQLVQVVFSAAALVLSSAAAYGLSHFLLAGEAWGSAIGVVILAGSVYFPVNSSLVAVVVGLAAGQSFRQALRPYSSWVFLYFMGGIIFASLISTGYREGASWKGAVVLIPAVILTHVYFLNRSTHQLTQEVSA